MATPVLSMATSTLSLDDVKESLDDSGKTNVKILTRHKDMSIFRSVLLEGTDFHSAHHLKIFVTGETGEGKSTLINSIIERKVAKTAGGAAKCTSQVKEYKKTDMTSTGISVSLFDSPGLNDCFENEDKYIRALEETCKEADLILYCKKLKDRLKVGDKEAMLKFTNRFGDKFWSYVVFVHTFANEWGYEESSSTDDSDSESKDGGLERKQKSFDTFLKQEERILKKHLREVVQVDHSIIEAIPFVPAGKYKKDTPNLLQLPDRNDWLKTMLTECCHQIKDKHKFKKLNLSHRLHLAIIINNDVETQRSQDLEAGDKSQADCQSETKGVQINARPTSPNSDLVRSTLEGLGYHVLYIDSLTSDNIKMLLEAFSNADHSDLAAFGLIVFSKGRSPHIYDADDKQVPFEKIFKHFEVGTCTNIPKIFFFHLNGSSTEKIRLPNPPSKSIALAVSVDPQGGISPAVRSFDNEMKNDICHTKPIIDVFGEIAQCSRYGVKCDLKYTIHEKFVLPVCYEAANTEDLVHQCSKQLKFCHLLWYRVRQNTVDNIIECKDEVLDAVKKARIAKIATSATSLVVGGGLTAAGLALLPFTFGGSFALSVAGSVIGATSTGTGSGIYIYTLVRNSKRLKATQKHIEFDQKFALNIMDASENYERAVQSYMAEGVSSAAAVSKLGLSIGNGVTIGVQGTIETASIAIRSTGRVIGEALGGATCILTRAAPIDVANIVYHAVRLAQSNKDESGKSDSDSVCQLLIKQSEELLISLFYFTKAEFVIRGDSIFRKNASSESQDSGDHDGTLCNEQDGFSLHVSRDTLKIDQHCLVSVASIFSGPFEIPAGATLVSAIYDVNIVPDKKIKLLKPLELTLQHCVEVTDSDILEHMCFGFAESDLKNKKFQFKKFEVGKIENEKGTIELKESCRLCILYLESDNIVAPMKYVFMDCDQRKSKNIWKKTVVVTKNLPTHVKYVKKKQHLKTSSCPIPFKFKPAHPPQIILQNFSERIDIDGWSIFRDTVPNKIFKSEIDTVEFQEFPKLQVIKLNVAAFNEQAQRELRYSTPLEGTDAKILFEFNKEI